MAWTTTLLPASFRGVPFDCVATSDDQQRAFAQHDYPYVDGGEVEDLGRMARRLSVTAVFWGDSYEAALQGFLKQWDTPGAGELVHPVFGALNCLLVGVRVPHDGDQPDHTLVTLDFVESQIKAPMFDRQLPASKIAAVDTAGAQVTAAAGDGFTKKVQAGLNDVRGFKARITAAMAGINGQVGAYLSALGQVRGVVREGQTYVANPRLFADDLSAGNLSRVQALFNPVDLRLRNPDFSAPAATVMLAAADPATVVRSRALDTTSMAAIWNGPRDHLALPLPSGGQVDADALVAALHAAACGAAAANLLETNMDTRTLTPADIEQVASDVRRVIVLAITGQRAAYPAVSDHRPAVEALKTLAYAIQEAAAASIQLRPPYLLRTTTADTSLPLLAHQWYGNHRRSLELLRLNPGVRHPNFIPVGEPIRGYAR